MSEHSRADKKRAERRAHIARLRASRGSGGETQIGPQQAIDALRGGEDEIRTGFKESDAELRSARIRANAARIALQNANRSGDPASIAAAGEAFGAARGAVADREASFKAARDRLSGNIRSRRRIQNAFDTEQEARRRSNEAGVVVTPDQIRGERREQLQSQLAPALEQSAAALDARAGGLTDTRTQLQGGARAVALQARGLAPVVNPEIDERIAGEAVRLREFAAENRARAAAGLTFGAAPAFVGSADRVGQASDAIADAETAVSEAEARAERARQRADLQQRLQTLPAEIAVRRGEQVLLGDNPPVEEGVLERADRFASEEADLFLRVPQSRSHISQIAAMTESLIANQFREGDIQSFAARLDDLSSMPEADQAAARRVLARLLDDAGIDVFAAELDTSGAGRPIFDGRASATRQIQDRQSRILLARLKTFLGM